MNWCGDLPSEKGNPGLMVTMLANIGEFTWTDDVVNKVVYTTITFCFNFVGLHFMQTVKYFLNDQLLSNGSNKQEIEKKNYSLYSRQNF